MARSSARFGFLKSRGHDGAALGRFDLSESTKTRQAKRKALDKPAFARRFCVRMTLASVDATTLVQRLALRGVAATERQINYFRGADANPETVRDPVLLGEIATELGCTVADFFYDRQETKVEPVADPRLEKAHHALDGPKATFLADAIDMAYAAWLTSQKN